MGDHQAPFKSTVLLKQFPWEQVQLEPPQLISQDRRQPLVLDHLFFWDHAVNNVVALDLLKEVAESLELVQVTGAEANDPNGVPYIDPL